MDYPALVVVLDAQVEGIWERQITDSLHAHFGGFVDGDRLAGT